MQWEIGKGNGTSRYIAKMKTLVPRVMKLFIIDAYRRVTIATPVDTGRARWGWNCSVNAIDYNVPPPGVYAVDAERAAIVFSKVKSTDILYIANSLPYIARLNQGSSKQAPARFVEMTFEQSKSALELYLRVNPDEN